MKERNTRADRVSEDQVANIEGMLNSGSLDPVALHRDLLFKQIKYGIEIEMAQSMGKDPSAAVDKAEYNQSILSLVEGFLRSKMRS